MKLHTMKFGLLFRVLCLVSSVYAQGGSIDGSFWWENNNNNNSTGRSPPKPFILTTNVTVSPVAHTTEKEEVWCTCVTWYLCNNNTIVTDGAGLLDIRATAVVNVEECPLNEGDQKEICCGTRPPTPSLPPTLTPVWCECVPQNLCNNGIINSDVAGIFDIRAGIRNVNVKVCPDEGEVCCGSPPVDSTTVTSSVGTTIEATTVNPTSTNIPIAPTGAPQEGNTTASSATILNTINLIQLLLIVTPCIMTAHLVY